MLILPSDKAALTIERTTSTISGIDELKDQLVNKTNKLSTNLDDINANILQIHSGQKQAFQSFDDKLDGVLDRVLKESCTSAGLTQHSFNYLDARLSLVLDRLQDATVKTSTSIARRPKRPTRKPSELLRRRISYRASKMEQAGSASGLKSFGLVQMLVRLIRPVILLQESGGQLLSELLPIEERYPASQDWKERVVLIKHVQGLRLLLWLFRQQNILPASQHYLLSRDPSGITKEASMFTLWAKRHTIEALRKNFMRKFPDFRQNTEVCHTLNHLMRRGASSDGMEHSLLSVHFSIRELLLKLPKERCARCGRETPWPTWGHCMFYAMWFVKEMKSSMSNNPMVCLKDHFASQTALL